MWFESSVEWLRDHLERHSSLFQKCPYCGKAPVVELIRDNDYFGRGNATCFCGHGMSVSDIGEDCAKVAQRVINRWNKLVIRRRPRL